jgi:pimeloyl-ACP methyl ester carboxylesterase
MARLISNIFATALAGLLMAGTATAASQVVDGRTGAGAYYGLAVPDAWNGDLVVYGHGIVDPAAPVVLPASQDRFLVLRDALLQRGFAVAYSSYSQNGFALKDAVQRLHQLTGLFTARYGPPAHVYLAGHSLGATAVQILAEQYPTQYSGALAMCGLLGGTPRELQYLGNARVLFDYYFPGVLPGNVLTVPANIVFGPGLPEFDAALAALLGGFAAPGAPTVQFAIAAGLPFANGLELVQAALTVLGFQLRFTNDLLGLVNGHPFFDNTSIVYPGAANSGAGRFTATADALNYFEHYFTPSGDLKFPMLSVHTTRDPAVPLFHESDYASVVQQRGNSMWLSQQTVTSFGHCAFTDEQVLSAFDSLVAWVRTGVRPVLGQTAF